MIEEQRRKPALEANIRPEQGQLQDHRDAEPESPSGKVSSIGPGRNPECSWVMVRVEPLDETKVFQLQEHRVNRGLGSGRSPGCALQTFDH